MRCKPFAKRLSNSYTYTYQRVGVISQRQRLTKMSLQTYSSAYILAVLLFPLMDL